MCNQGGFKDSYHCDTCGVCYPKTGENIHFCRKGKYDLNCPVC